MNQTQERFLSSLLAQKPHHSETLRIIRKQTVLSVARLSYHGTRRCYFAHRLRQNCLLRHRPKHATTEGNAAARLVFATGFTEPSGREMSRKGMVIPLLRSFHKEAQSSSLQLRRLPIRLLGELPTNISWR